MVQSYMYAVYPVLFNCPKKWLFVLSQTGEAIEAEKIDAIKTKDAIETEEL